MTVVETCLDDMDARRAAAEAVLAEPVFEIGRLDAYRPDGKIPAAWCYLDNLVGVELETLPQHGREAVRRSVHEALGIPFAEPVTDEPKQLMDIQIESPEQASRVLDAIRLGQPTPMMMRYLSPRAIKACDHLQSRFSRKMPTVKLVLGEMGMGKTTLARLIQEAALRGGAVPVHYCMPHVTHSRPAVLVEMMIARAELYQAAVERIAAMFAAGDVAAIEAVKRSTHGHRIQPALDFMIKGGEFFGRSGKPVPPSLAGAVANAMSAWLLAGRPSMLSDLLKSMGAQRVTLGKIDQSEVLELLRTHLTFFAACGVYPVWLVDEFESINGLQNGQLQTCLGYFRDVVDLLMSAPAVAGAMFLFSTGDGARAIRQYPALNDRLQGSERFTLSSPTWAMKAFGEWDVEQVIETLRRLYMGAAQAGDTTAQGVAEYIDLLRNEHFMTLAQHVAGDATVEARVRLKSLIVGVLDLLEDGPQEFAEAVQESLAQYKELPNPSAKTAPEAQLSASVDGQERGLLQVLADYERGRKAVISSVSRRHGPATPVSHQPTAEEAVEMMADDVFGGLDALAGSLGAPAQALATKDTWLDNMLANPRARGVHRNAGELTEEVRQILARADESQRSEGEKADPKALVKSINSLLGQLSSDLSLRGTLPPAHEQLYPDVDPLEHLEQMKAESASQRYPERPFDLESMLPPACRPAQEPRSDARAPLEQLADQLKSIPLPPVGTNLYGRAVLDVEETLGLKIEGPQAAGAGEPAEAGPLAVDPPLTKDDIEADHLLLDFGPLLGGPDFGPLLAGDDSLPALMRYSERRHFGTLEQAAERLAKAGTPAHFAAWLSAYRDLGGEAEKVSWKFPRGCHMLAVQEDTRGALGAVRRLVDRLAENRELARVTVTVSRPAPAADAAEGEAEPSEQLAEPGTGIEFLEPEPEAELDDELDDAADADEPAQAGADGDEAAATEKKRKTRKRRMVDEDRLIDPFRSPGALRHFVYTYLAALGLVPEDKWVDAMVLEVSRQHFGFEPRTSRHGVQFLTPKRGLLSMFGGKTCIAEDPLRPPSMLLD
ncbi:BREX system ATP-binding domain-containing protein [Geopseudomonas aromaticivorans]